MMLNILKRDGSIVPFDKNKIISAINKAFIEVDGKLYEDDTAKDIADEIYYIAKHYPMGPREFYSVEQIQNDVETFLMRSERKDVAKAYIRYRQKHEIAREGYANFIKGYSKKINATDIENQNANVDEYSFGGRIGAGSDLMMKKYALDFCVSDMARRNHENNEIYIHDLSAYAVGESNCLSIPFDDLLARGFNTRQTDVRPAGSVSTAMQLVAVIFQLQSLQQFGGVAATHLDWTMVPYVRKSFSKHFKDGCKYLQGENSSRVPKELAFNDPEANDPRNKRAYQFALEMTEREVHQAVEGLYHNLKFVRAT